MKVYAAYGWSSESLSIVFAHSRDDAEFELGRLRYSGAKRIGITPRPARPRVLAQHLIHRFQGTPYTIRHLAGKA